MADFPTTIYTPRAVVNLPGLVLDPLETANLFAEDVNLPNAEIVAIETVLGTSPNGAYATVKAWLTALTGAVSWLFNGAKIYYSGGNVGIGTNDPVALLEMKAASPVHRFWGTSGSTNRTRYQLRKDGDYFYIDSVLDAGTVFKSMRFDTDGNVVIAGNLNINGTALSLAAGLNVFTSGKFGYDSNGYIQFNTGGAQVLQTPGTDPIRFRSSTGPTNLLVIKKGGTVVQALSDSAGSVAFEAKAAASPTASVFVVSSSASTGDLFAVDSGGRIGINNSAPNASAQLDVVSTSRGFLPPRMTTTQKNAIATPATGLVVFDSTLAKLCLYTGAAWETVTSA